MIDVQNLTYEYPGKRALDNVSFSIAAGSITALVGPNGAGKTTLLRCIAALDDAYSGNISVAGLDVDDAPREIHKKLGYLSDFFGLYDDLTVQQSLTFAARLHQLDDAAVKNNIAWVVQLMGLGPYQTKKISSLSRGWRQRVGIAQAIIHQPVLILLDEPASGLDPEARASLSHIFRSLRDHGMTLVVSSHILAELEDYCTDMLILRDGKIVNYNAVSTEHGVAVEMTVSNVDEAQRVLNGMQNISAVDIAGNQVKFRFNGDDDAEKNLLKVLIAQGLDVASFSRQQNSLQDIYLSVANQTNANSAKGQIDVP